jgi:hypothetical protein
MLAMHNNLFTLMRMHIIRTLNFSIRVTGKQKLRRPLERKRKNQQNYSQKKEKKPAEFSNACN